MAAAGACLRIKMLCSMKGCAGIWVIYCGGGGGGPEEGTAGDVALVVLAPCARVAACVICERHFFGGARRGKGFRVLAARVEHAAVYKFAP